MSRYFQLSESAKIDEIGQYAQVECKTPAQASVLSAWEFPKATPQLVFQLEKKAKFTDVLSCFNMPASGFIVSQNLKDKLDQFKLMGHRYYECTVVQNVGEELTYYWLHLCQQDIRQQLDYTQSVFYEQEYEFRTDIIEINNYEHYQELLAADEDAAFTVDLDKIIFKSHYNIPDLFRILPFSSKTFISEDLKSAMLESETSGIDIRYTNEFDI